MHWPTRKESPHPLGWRTRFDSQKTCPQKRACNWRCRTEADSLKYFLLPSNILLLLEAAPCRFRAHTQTWTKTMRFLQELGCPSFSHFLTLNSSEISDMKEEICFMSRSMLLSLPVFSSVVMARVAMLRLESVTRFSRSRLQAVTADGCFMATCSSEGRMKIPQQMQKAQLEKPRKTHSFQQK